MRAGITLRVTASHVALVVIALTVFSAIVITTANEALSSTGTNVDRATALRLAPWIEELYLRQNSWSDIDQALRGLSLEGHPRTRRSPMMMENRGPMTRSGDRAAAPFFERDVVVVDRSGELLAATPATRLPPNLDLDRGVTINLDSVPDARVFVGSMISTQDNPIRRAIMTSFLQAGTVAALIIIVGAIGVSTLWARWLLLPLRSIEAASRAMEEGNYSVTVPEPTGDHEIRTLARSFNAMAAEISQQEETRRRFVADAAHELRTPVSLLSGRIELLRDGVYEATPDQWRALQQSVSRIASLVADLQTIARLDAGRVMIQPAEIDPIRMLYDVVEEFGPAAHAGSVTISVNVPNSEFTPPARITADPAKLHQIIVNLLSNALRHTPSGGTVVLSAYGGSDPERSEHGGVILAVEDSGPGIPLSERERVFERFVRLDADRGRDHGGSGLGLSITHRLVELHGGTIRAVEP
ncbi:MAG TPA: ATP-binding protein, partial [Alkalispirochaeta sp.]|nr:ATP-binding protein [Alkalispirochaeta sp.]